MATTSKEKKASTGKRTTKKQTVQEQLETLDKALESIEGKDVKELLPEEVKADIEAEAIETEVEEPKEVDFDEEVKEILENAEPSEEVKEKIEEFETGKEEFNKKITTNPENAAEVVKNELKRVEELKKKVQALDKNISKVRNSQNRNDIFTNVWNGVGYDF